MILEDLALNCRKIFIRDLRLLSRVGIYANEIEQPQAVLVSIEVWVPKTPVGDDIENTVDYDRLADIARDAVQNGHTFLIETLVERMIGRLKTIPSVRAGRVNCRKLHAVRDAGSSGVEEFFLNP